MSQVELLNDMVHARLSTTEGERLRKILRFFIDGVRWNASGADLYNKQFAERLDEELIEAGIFLEDEVEEDDPLYMEDKC